MRMTVRTFLRAFIIYMILCSVYFGVNPENDSVHVFVSAVTIAGTLFSLSDIFFTFSECKKNDIQLFDRVKKEVYEISKNLEETYGQKAWEKVNNMSEEEMDKFLSDNSELNRIIEQSEQSHKQYPNIRNDIKYFIYTFQKISSALTIVAISILMFFTTIRLSIPDRVNDLCTVIAFLLVLINLYVNISYKENLDAMYQEIRRK